MLQLWQETARRLTGGALHLITPGVAQSAAGSGEGGVAAAALAALMRVAAAENPSVSITGSEQAVALPAHSQKVSKNLFCNSLLLTCNERILPQEHMLFELWFENLCKYCLPRECRLWVQQAAGAAGANRAFGDAVCGGVQMQARLVRSNAHARSPDCHIVPCPRGALSDLRAVPLDSASPGPGEIKVRHL